MWHTSQGRKIVVLTIKDIYTYIATNRTTNDVFRPSYKLLTWSQPDHLYFSIKTELKGNALNTISSEVTFSCEVDCNLKWHFQ